MRLHLKVSPDGSTWYEALNIAQSSGLVSLPVGQLAFPATQNPSANANTLDDYREGLWTPAVTFGGAAVGVTYSGSNRGRYTKIGRLVAATGILSLSDKGSSTGGAAITGLPFSSVNAVPVSSAPLGYATNMSSISGAVLGIVPQNSAVIALYHTNGGNSSSLTNANFTNTTGIYFTIVYDAA